MSRTLRNTRKGTMVCEKDVDWRCKCSYCTREVYWKKEKKTIKREAAQEEVAYGTGQPE